jgi:CheY-like chemotaxis protein
MASGENVQAQCEAAGADDFLLKPFMPEDLLNKLNSTRQS